MIVTSIITFVVKMEIVLNGGRQLQYKSCQRDISDFNGRENSTNFDLTKKYSMDICD